LKSKWNNYVIGKIPFVINTAGHAFRDNYAHYILENNIKSVIEFGGGEMLEYQKIRGQGIDYTSVDVSSTFLGNCRKKYPEVHRIKCEVEKFSNDKSYQLAYASMILEHTSDVGAAVKNIINAGEEFYLVMFRWKYGGDLKPAFQSKKRYYSSSFNIRQLIKVIEEQAIITNLCVTDNKTGICTDFDKYNEKLPKMHKKVHRTGNYLIIQGHKT